MKSCDEIGEELAPTPEASPMSVSQLAAARAEVFEEAPREAAVPLELAHRADSDRLEVPVTPVDSAPAPAATLESIYREHYRFVWRSGLRMGVPRDQIEDVVQDVFVVVSERLHTFEGRSSLSTWLFAILFRVAAQHRRKQTKAQRKEAPAMSRPMAADENLARKEAAELFERMLDELEPDQRAIFVLFELDRTPAKEIADALGIKVNTVYSRLRLARKKLNRSLARFKARDDRESPRRSSSVLRGTS